MRQGATNDDSVTAVSFLISLIRLWHAPSQDGGNLFICAEERGKGGQLASTIRHPSDKQYITAWDSQTNERQKKCSFRLDRILQLSCYINHLYGTWHTHSHLLPGVTSNSIGCLQRHSISCHARSGLLKGTSVMSNASMQSHVHQCNISSSKSFTLYCKLLYGYHMFIQGWSFKSGRYFSDVSTTILF